MDVSEVRREGASADQVDVGGGRQVQVVDRGDVPIEGRRSSADGADGDRLEGRGATDRTKSDIGVRACARVDIKSVVAVEGGGVHVDAVVDGGQRDIRDEVDIEVTATIREGNRCATGSRTGCEQVTTKCYGGVCGDSESRPGCDVAGRDVFTGKRYQITGANGNTLVDQQVPCSVMACVRRRSIDHISASVIGMKDDVSTCAGDIGIHRDRAGGPGDVVTCSLNRTVDGHGGRIDVDVQVGNSIGGGGTVNDNITTRVDGDSKSGHTGLEARIGLTGCGEVAGRQAVIDDDQN